MCATRSCSCSGMCRPGGTASSRATVNSGSAGMHRPQAYCSALLSGAPPHAAPDAACAHRRVPRAPRSAQCAHCARPRRLVHGAHRGTGPFAIPPRLSGAREPLGAAAGAGGRRQPQRMGRARPAARAAHPTSLGAVPPAPPPSRSPDASHRIALNCLFHSASAGSLLPWRFAPCRMAYAGYCAPPGPKPIAASLHRVGELLAQVHRRFYAHPFFSGSGKSPCAFTPTDPCTHARPAHGRNPWETFAYPLSRAPPRSSSIPIVCPRLVGAARAVDRDAQRRGDFHGDPGDGTALTPPVATVLRAVVCLVTIELPSSFQLDGPNRASAFSEIWALALGRAGHGGAQAHTPAARITVRRACRWGPPCASIDSSQ
jgi:hypothetical protein